MKEDDATPDGSPGAFAYFYTPQVTELVGAIVKIQAIAQEFGWRNISREALSLMREVLDDINRISLESSELADALIVRELHATRSSRPDTGALESHIFSKPGPLGEVRVALLDELDRAIRAPWGPYWRAQEYGTGTEKVPSSQIDRVLFGTFYDSVTPPDKEQQGLGVGRDARFVPEGSNPGWGTISVELPGRHFLARGSTEAGEQYVTSIQDAQAGWVERLEWLAASLQSEVRTRTITAIVDA